MGMRRGAKRAGRLAAGLVVALFAASCSIRVTPTGAHFSFAADDLVVDVPPNAVAADVTLMSVALPEPAGAHTVPNTAFMITPVDGWASPVRVALAYAVADLPAGVAEADLTLVRKSGTDWLPVDGSTVDTGRHVVSANVSTLGPLAIGWTGCDRRLASSCTLRQAAAPLGIRIGTTLEPAQIADAAYTTVVTREFSSITPENALKMYSIENQRGVWTFAAADAVVDFATSHSLTVRGHTLVWAQPTYTPAWVAAITDPAELRRVTDEYISTVVGRYAGRVPRWDVVNEPFTSLGAVRSSNVWDRLLGANWIADAFRTAHAADPAAELWLNEYGTDWVPGKHAALLALVTQLVRDGVPINGVGLQTHRLSTDGPDPSAFRRQLADFTALGLKVAITEVDVPTDPTDAAGPMKQAAAYDRIVSACVAVRGCEEVTTWNLDDGDTWLDHSGLFRTPTRPLLFDENLAPKAAYRSVLAALCSGRRT